MANATSQNRFIFYFIFLTYHTLPFFLFLSSGTSIFERASSPRVLTPLPLGCHVRTKLLLFHFSLSQRGKKKKIMHHPNKEICTRGRTTARHHLALERGQTRTPANTIWRWFPKSLQTRWQFRITQCYYVVRNISFVSSPSKYSGRNWNMVCLDL